MRADCFLDTNILVYGFDHSAPQKRDRARRLVRERSDWVISWQVVQEFSNVALHRFATPMQSADLCDYMEYVLLPNCRIFPTGELYQKAVRIHAQTHYRFYDSLIIASAIAAGASVLYTEDLQHGQITENLRIENPFRSLNLIPSLDK